MSALVDAARGMIKAWPRCDKCGALASLLREGNIEDRALCPSHEYEMNEEDRDDWTRLPAYYQLLELEAALKDP